MEQMQQQVSRAQKALSDLKSRFTAAKHNRDKASGDLQSTQSDISGLKEQKGMSEKAIDKLTSDIRALELEVSALLLLLLYIYIYIYVCVDVYVDIYIYI